MPDEAQVKDRILVVDDQPDSLRFIVDTLEHGGMGALVATSGQAAIELLSHVRPDLILMDAVMPGMTGFETTRQIKRDPDLAHVPVIFMTGLTDAEHAVAALESGGVDYIRKPIVIEEMLARIRVHLTNARISHRSRIALDGAGRRIVALDPDGALLWCTPQADELLNQIDPDRGTNAQHLPAPLLDVARRLMAEAPRPGSATRIEIGNSEVELVPVRSERPEETLFRIREIREEADVALLQTQIGLTQREAEVLLWISYGKPNRTISEILGISPRTVNKHLQQIFAKLGVETRAAAAALAVRVIAE
ncbi:response regulator [Altericroceibacterium endophyticum]|uniref:Response regulator n=1 Tax=Altericroceibacterium endophyticum TaxID=1808508 RepID=A0A6I4T6V3_9SPHN|nr:response regulator [Altericroceibacterium endophyticum]MXO65565.1 response regulator [Altericroceibacterium endophyticum]